MMITPTARAAVDRLHPLRPRSAFDKGLREAIAGTRQRARISGERRVRSYHERQYGARLPAATLMAQGSLTKSG
jgi:hypothetical protein